MDDIGQMTFEQLLKGKFGDTLGGNLLQALKDGIAANEKSYALKKRLIKAIALSDDDDEVLEKKKLQAATTFNGYWVWIVFGIPAAEEK